MKNISQIKLLMSLLFVLSLFMLTNCGKETPLTEAEKVTAVLASGQWKMNSASVDGTDQSSVYQGLTLNFTATGFTSTNGEPIWPATGTWQFTNDNARAMKRNDGVEVSINESTDSKLVLQMSWSKTTLGSGRINSVGGQHIITFRK